MKGKISMTAQRMAYLTIATVIGIGIWHTGLDKASWVLYIPMGFTLFAGVTGICPGAIFGKKCGLT
jgi:hypothetical protein